jgi:hypothetical protein
MNDFNFTARNEKMQHKIKIVEEINHCRLEILSEGASSDPVRIAQCVRKTLEGHSDNAHVKLLLENMENHQLGSNNLLELTFTDDPDFILGFFEVPYNPDAFLEAAFVEAIAIPQNVLDIVPESEALPVLLHCCSDGFKNPLSVAIFAENFRDAEVKPYHKAYYLIEKFVDRFKSYTRPAIEAAWSPTAFPDVITADDDLLTRASAIWVHLHEYYHRTGYLPLPEHLKEKSSRNGAGAEELRVDILSILALLDLHANDPVLRASIQYILAERLIRYPLQAPPKENYDARSSVALFEYLQRHGVIGRKGGRFYFVGGYARLGEALRSILVNITALEDRISQSPADDRKKKLSFLLPDLAKNNNRWELLS